MTPPAGAQLLIILFIVLLLFGAQRLPDLALALGESLKQFRRASEDDTPERNRPPDGPAS